MKQDRSAVFSLFIGLAALLFLYCPYGPVQAQSKGSQSRQTSLTVRHNKNSETLSVVRAGEQEPLLTQHVRPDFRPYLHPIVPPDGKGSFTEYSPGHHRHQTGLYWGFTRLNGRDYFHHPGGDYWQRVSAEVLEAKGPVVRWKTVYNLLDENGNPVLTETQLWSMRQEKGRYLLGLEWRGEAQTDVTIGAYDYGGLFLRMPWEEGIEGRVVNAARQQGQEAEGQRAMWLDVGMKVEGRSDRAHVAIFDHPKNAGFPQPWRVDGQMGVGPVRARLGNWNISSGETEVIRHQLVFYTGELGDVELRDLWEAYSGQEGQYSVASLWEIAQAEGRKAKFLTPEESAQQMSLPEGFKVNPWAGEPMLSQPMAFAWDDQGRLWVAENRDYESRSSGFSNSGDSRIVILEDTNGDGKADSRKVFLDNIPFPSAIEVGFGGLFLGAPPHLLFVPDRNEDDVADRGKIEILRTGWGIRDRHETINSFHWGPDGWLYGLEGFATPSKIRKPNKEDRLYKPGDEFPDDILEGEGVDINGGVWRYHPVKDRFEVVAHGFSNPWGIDYDAKGQLFISACVIPHLFHVIPGGIYHRQGGQHFNPHVYNDIGTIVDHRHRSAHGGARVYQSDAFPEKHRGRLFMANIHEHALLSDVLTPSGSGFTARHGQDFLKANNAQWVGFSVEVGPEGAIYVLDWHDGDICGKDVLDKNTGRIFRIMPKESRAKDWKGRYADLGQMSDVRLAKMQLRKSNWHSRRARVILQHRATKRPISSAAEDTLRKIFNLHSNPDLRLRGMWALHVTGLLGQQRLLKALKDKDQYVRGWAVQLLTEDQAPGPKALAAFARMAQNDPSPVVRKYLAAALQRIDHNARWKVAQGLVSRAEDANDHNIPKMTWLGIEPLVAEDPDRALGLASTSKLPMVTESIARRAVDADQLGPLTEALGRYTHVRLALLQGMRAGLEGRTELEKPVGWDQVYPELRANEETAPLALEIAQFLGDGGAAQQLLASLKEKTTPLEQRQRALRSLADQKHKGLVEELPALLDKPALRAEAIRAVASFKREHLGELLLDRYAEFSGEEKQAAVQTLASRPVYGWLLTKAIKSETIPRRDIPADIARQMRRVVGSGFVEVWGPIDGASFDKEEAYEKYKALLTPGAIAEANVKEGRQVFERTCGSCHKMYGQGGAVGPELTGSNRTDLEYLLGNILNPSEVIQDDYKMVIINMRGGRTHIGNVTAENDRQVTLRVVGQDPVVLNKSGIQSREVSDSSLMPQGLLRTLSEEEVLELIAYLQTTEQVPLPAK